jgi:hypothetical protein
VRVPSGRSACWLVRMVGVALMPTVGPAKR